MRFKIDYLSFTIKPDKNAEHSTSGLCKKPLAVKLLPLLHMLHLSDRDIDILLSHDYGPQRCYDHTFILNGSLHVYVTDMAMSGLDISQIKDKRSLDRYYLYGINVELKGSGCRLFEKLWDDDPECYRQLFGKLLYLVQRGAALNICRLDLAFDDIVLKGEVNADGTFKEGLLSLDLINSIITNKCELENKLLDNFEFDTDGTEIFSSLYRVFYPDTSSSKLKYYDADARDFRSRYMTGTSVYFGSRESDSFCKFYDKLVEQHSLHQNDLQYLRDELTRYSHWVRFEFTFKNDFAIKIVNKYLSSSDSDFMQFVASTINSYLRFIVYDDTNISRCSVCDWWSDFIGSVERAKISVVGFAENPAAKAVRWVIHGANTFNALIKLLGKDAFLKLIQDNERPECYTGKHRAIMSADNLMGLGSCSNYDYWQYNKPLV